MKPSRNPFHRLWNFSRDAGLPSTLSSPGTTADPRQLAFLRSMKKDLLQQNSGTIPLQKLEVVVVDLETTGFYPDHGDEILSIGAVAMRGSEVLQGESFYSLVNPRRGIPEHIASLTGIKPGMAEGAPELIVVLSRFFQFVGNRLLVAHHSRHEREFLRAALWKTSRAKFTHRLLDTMLLIRLLNGPLGNTSLDALCAAHQIEISRRHHAYCDAFAAAALWGIYVEKAIRQGYHDLQQVYADIGYR
ncbi:exonuclease domain-containing protein [Brevibacillus sp. H7]|jgi:DNA polymerase-3 subunit epsilon|uniref:exonuclease domain-containing protein n=1 Tax=Brevibacillus sp. H7 TaxID=3349138 RepID=UPI00380137D5